MSQWSPAVLILMKIFLYFVYYISYMVRMTLRRPLGLHVYLKKVDWQEVARMQNELRTKAYFYCSLFWKSLIEETAFYRRQVVQLGLNRAILCFNCLF